MPSSSEMRSQGKMMKSEVIASWTSGSRRISAVPVVWFKSTGASISGLGEGREVSDGFVARAASSGEEDSGGVINVMSA